MRPVPSSRVLNSSLVKFFVQVLCLTVFVFIFSSSCKKRGSEVLSTDEIDTGLKAKQLDLKKGFTVKFEHCETLNGSVLDSKSSRFYSNDKTEQDNKIANQVILELGSKDPEIVRFDKVFKLLSENSQQTGSQIYATLDSVLRPWLSQFIKKYPADPALKAIYERSKVDLKSSAGSNDSLRLGVLFHWVDLLYPAPFVIEDIKLLEIQSKVLRDIKLHQSLKERFKEHINGEFPRCPKSLKTLGPSLSVSASEKGGVNSIATVRSESGEFDMKIETGQMTFFNHQIVYNQDPLLVLEKQNKGGSYFLLGNKKRLAQFAHPYLASKIVDLDRDLLYVWGMDLKQTFHSDATAYGLKPRSIQRFPVTATTEEAREVLFPDGFELQPTDKVSGYARSLCIAQGKSLKCNLRIDETLFKTTDPNAQSKIEFQASVLPEDISSLSVADQMACLVAGSKVYCLGYNPLSLLGLGVRNSSVEPSLVEVGSENEKFTQVFAFKEGTCLLGERNVFCWGLNQRRQINDKYQDRVLKPERLLLPEDLFKKGPSAVRSVVLTSDFLCLLSSSDQLYCRSALLIDASSDANNWVKIAAPLINARPTVSKDFVFKPTQLDMDKFKERFDFKSGYRDAIEGTSIAEFIYPHAASHRTDLNSIHTSCSNQGRTGNQKESFSILAASTLILKVEPDKVPRKIVGSVSVNNPGWHCLHSHLKVKIYQGSRLNPIHEIEVDGSEGKTIDIDLNGTADSLKLTVEDTAASSDLYSESSGLGVIFSDLKLQY